MYWLFWIVLGFGIGFISQSVLYFKTDIFFKLYIREKTENLKLRNTLKEKNLKM